MRPPIEDRPEARIPACGPRPLPDRLVRSNRETASVVESTQWTDQTSTVVPSGCRIAMFESVPAAGTAPDGITDLVRSPWVASSRVTSGSLVDAT